MTKKQNRLVPFLVMILIAVILPNKNLIAICFGSKIKCELEERVEKYMDKKPQDFVREIPKPSGEKRKIEKDIYIQSKIFFEKAYLNAVLGPNFYGERKVKGEILALNKYKKKIKLPHNTVIALAVKKSESRFKRYKLNLMDANSLPVVVDGQKFFIKPKDGIRCGKVENGVFSLDQKRKRSIQVSVKRTINSTDGRSKQEIEEISSKMVPCSIALYSDNRMTKVGGILGARKAFFLPDQNSYIMYFTPPKKNPKLGKALKNKVFIFKFQEVLHTTELIKLD